MTSKSACDSMPSSSTFQGVSAPVHPESVSTMPPRPTSSVSSQPVIEFTGTTIFARPPAPTYHYAISLRNDKLRIWLEDCDSKKQWCTTELSIDAYVDPTNAIPDATSADYVECFREVLNSAEDGTMNSISSTFCPIKGDTFRLEIAVTIQVLRKSGVMTYAFVLEPITVERIDVLESKMQDMQREMNKLRLDGETKSATFQSEVREVKKLQQESEARAIFLTKALGDAQAQKESVVVYQSIGTSRVGDIIRWNSSNASSAFGDDGVIRIPHPGLYQIMVVVNHHADHHAEVIQLMRGTACIQVAWTGYAKGNPSSTSLMCIARIDKEDQLTVKCPSEVVSSSSITLIRLGNYF
ncbi:hypothetical protein PF008_g18634 [Phytophthora fragariae]|uniref:C1q domain-containing protein n=1 Tax=Phytophthora fragariae TaxID=53985 RepID=A0A6G0R534_9STRA|nr:hypothetical protein PF008_g18634 [Phytophthora fragariae]